MIERVAERMTEKGAWESRSRPPDSLLDYCARMMLGRHDAAALGLIAAPFREHILSTFFAA